MKKKILCIDDSPLILEIVLEILSYHGFDVTVTNDGIDGLVKLGSENFDLVITDLVMPRINGMDVIREIKKSTGFSNIPVIVLSSEDTLEIRNKVLNLGAKRFIKKPFIHSEFVDVVTLELQ
jgi:DNA-binding response OmpR family regulator